MVDFGVVIVTEWGKARRKFCQRPDQTKIRDHRAEWAVRLAKLGREKAQIGWQTEIYGKN
jgi:hypothetical protein